MKKLFILPLKWIFEILCNLPLADWKGYHCKPTCSRPIHWGDFIKDDNTFSLRISMTELLVEVCIPVWGHRWRLACTSWIRHTWMNLIDGDWRSLWVNQFITILMQRWLNRLMPLGRKSTSWIAMAQLSVLDDRLVPDVCRSVYTFIDRP